MFFLRFIVLLFLAAFSFGMGMTPSNELNAFGTLVAPLFFIFAPALYMLPTYEAWKLDHPNLGAISLVNIFLGWSLIGWVVALVWAFKKPEIAAATEMQPTVAPSIYANKATKTCPFCAEEILAAAIKCKHCGSPTPA